MTEDAKVAEKRRLAEALRANLKRRKAAASKLREHGPAREPAAGAADGGNGD